MNIVLFAEEELDRPLSASDRRTKHITSILGLGPGDTFRAGVVNGVSGTATVTDIALDGSLEFAFEPGPAPAGAPEPGAAAFPEPGAAAFPEPAPAGAPEPPGAGGTGGNVGLQPVRLLLGHPRPIVLKRLLRDLSSLGVERIVVAHTALGEKSYFESNLWHDGTIESLLREGAEQAGSTRLPTVERAWTISRGIERIVDQWESAERVVFDNGIEASRPAGANEKTGGSRRILAVGSERGWTDGERAAFAEDGFDGRYLGERVLRTETAAIVAVALTLRELGRW